MDPNARALDLCLSTNPETFTLEQKQNRWVGGLDVFLARLLGSKPDRGALCLVPDQDTLTGALGSVHVPLSRLKK